MAWSPQRRATLPAPCKISDSNNLGQHVLCKYFTCKISDDNNLGQHVPKVRGDIGPLPIMVWYWRVTCYSEEYWSTCSTASCRVSDYQWPALLPSASALAFWYPSSYPLRSLHADVSQPSFMPDGLPCRLFSYYFLRNSQECLRTLCSVIFVDIHTTHRYLHCFCFDGM